MKKIILIILFLFPVGLEAREANKDFVKYLHIKNAPEIEIVSQNVLNQYCLAIGMRSGYSGLFLINSKRILISEDAQDKDLVEFHELVHYSVYEQGIDRGLTRQEHEEIAQMVTRWYFENK